MLKTLSTLALALALTSAFGIQTAKAEDSKAVSEVKEAGRDVKKGAKKAGRKVKDETCEMVNGKMECAAKKAGHKIENAGDELKDKAE
jgi:cytochrome c5